MQTALSGHANLSEKRTLLGLSLCGSGLESCKKTTYRLTDILHKYDQNENYYYM